MTEPVLHMWTIYHNPVDHPGRFVARRFEVGTHSVTPTRDMYTADTLAEVRALLPFGLIYTPRQVGDDATIVEVWI